MYKSLSVVEFLDKAIRILSVNDQVKERYMSVIHGLERSKSIAEANTYRIGIIGVTSSGKSTLINSLLGGDLLPSGVKPSSNQLVRCHHSVEKKAIVYFENGSSITLNGEALTQEQVSAFADEGVNSCNEKGVKEIEILSPDLPFDDDVLLIDSPGLDAFGYEGHEKLTMTSLLPTVDMCMLITICKSNSDEKIKDILDTIAETGTSGMPVIIVQNMMDSIVATPDGTKSRDEVAKDHIHRIERIVDSSQLKEKSSVSIIQFSAIDALTGRKENRNELLVSSNYYKLLDVVNDKLSVVRPTISYNRIDRVRQKLQKIIEEARRDAGSNIVTITDPFPYDSVIENLDLIMALVEVVERETMTALDQIRNDILWTNSFTSKTLDSFLNKENGVQTKLLNTINEYNVELRRQCSRLNIDVRDLYSPTVLGRNHTPTMHRTKNEVKVKKKGVSAFFHRLFGSSSGYETITTYTTDHDSIRKDLLEYHDDGKTVLIGFISSWKERNALIRKEIDDEILLLKKADSERISRALVAQSYIDIAEQLSELVSKMPDRPMISSCVSDARIIKPEDELFQIEVSKPVHELYSLSLNLKNSIQELILVDGLDSNGRILVIGGDKNTEVFFLTQMLHESIDEGHICDGKNVISDKVFLCHGYNIPEDVHFEDYSSVFILISGTQVGSAEGPLYSISDRVKDCDNVQLFWVVQDFQEVVNARDIEGCLRELNRFAMDYFPKTNIKLVLAHDNPLYNLVLSAIQEKGHLSTADSVVISSDLESLGYLKDNQSNDVIHDIIKAYT